ncbi:MAG: hypothetical protein SV487_04220 [Thermodesulfobacteriota bacterium]|nr:hypothetical protein [Thermodesulfobacteriota bacterium]
MTPVMNCRAVGFPPHGPDPNMSYSRPSASKSAALLTSPIMLEGLISHDFPSLARHSLKLIRHML